MVLDRALDAFLAHCALRSSASRASRSKVRARRRSWLCAASSAPRATWDRAWGSKPIGAIKSSGRVGNYAEMFERNLGRGRLSVSIAGRTISGPKAD